MLIFSFRESSPNGSKTGGSERICIDYRNLSDFTPDASWPIPNVAEMLRRIGSDKPKVSGYHQAATTFATLANTTVFLFRGEYQFTSLPFRPNELLPISNKLWQLLFELVEDTSLVYTCTLLVLVFTSVKIHPTCSSVYLHVIL